jgi:hypothetical protein
VDSMMSVLGSMMNDSLNDSYVGSTATRRQPLGTMMNDSLKISYVDSSAPRRTSPLCGDGRHVGVSIRSVNGG